MKEFDRTYLSVDLNAIKNNIKSVRENINKDTLIMAIVKANAYGHGAIEVASALKDISDFFGVATIEEALELRTAGIDNNILILGYTGSVWYEDLVTNNISQTIYNLDAAKKLSEVAVKLGKTAKIHIKLDTGMGRIGFFPNTESISLVKEISTLPNIFIEGIFTHFAKSDETDLSYTDMQFDKYMNFISMLEKENIHVPIKHVSNSAGIIQYKKANLNMVRSGIITYGLYPSELVPKDVLKLKPAMQWKATISNVKSVEKGTSISYGGTFVAKEPTKVATIPIGYADGLKRTLSNKGQVLIGGKRCNIVGRICMDQFMADVSKVKNVKINDEVTIFGEDGMERITLEEIAQKADSFNYEFPCTISDRVKRKYIC